MAKLQTFSAIGDGTYRVNDMYHGYVGRTIRTTGDWVGVPPREDPTGTRRVWSTRWQAAHALARFADTVADGSPNRDWIA